GIGKEEARRELVLAAAEFAVPVAGELVVVVAPGLADGKSAAAWYQEAVRAVELIALELQQFHRDGIQPADARGQSTREECRDERRCAAAGRQHRNCGADKSTRRKAAALAGALVVGK